MAALRASRLWYLLQLLGTLAILAFVPDTVLQTLLFLAWWALTFWPLSRQEWILFIISCAAFIGGDISMTHRGVYEFAHQDLLGLPYYEPLVWGFYLLHAKRMIRGAASRRIWPGILFGIAIAAVSSVFADPRYTLAAFVALLIIGFFFFHTKKDVQYAGYLFFVGILVEFVGTATGQWTYPAPYLLAIGLLAWAASGLILYRAILPVSAYFARL